MLAPEDCADLGDIRHAIDTLDRELLTLLGKRMHYVLAASKFKPDEQSIPAPERVASMLADRSCWAEGCGLDGEFARSLFEQITSWYIARQVDYWRAQRGLQ